MNDEIRRGRDAEMATCRLSPALGSQILQLTAIATRGERLALTRTRGATSGPIVVDTEFLRIVEIDADERMSARVVFDLDDIDAAFEELDARYLAGEAAAHAADVVGHRGAHAALNRHELPATTPDWVTIDHRPVDCSRRAT